MRVIPRTRIFVVAMACSMGMTIHGISRTVSGVVGPKVCRARLLRGSGSRRLGMLSWRMCRMKGGAKRTVVFTPGQGLSKGKVSGQAAELMNRPFSVVTQDCIRLAHGVKLGL